MKLPLSIVDAFAEKPFEGNPAAVVLAQDRNLPDPVMQQIAMEMNLSETAFVLPNSELRWFTPRAEVDLCGHATLAAAHVLGSSEPIRFLTKSGELTVTPYDESWIMDFPAEPIEECDLPIDLGMNHRFAGRNRMDWMVVVDTEDDVRDAAPDLDKVEQLGMRGLIITAPAKDYDFVSRCFYPVLGIPEDPVTGSAHCALGPFWADRFGRQNLRGRQISARGGTVHVQVEGDRVLLRGQAVTTLRGTLDF